MAVLINGRQIAKRLNQQTQVMVSDLAKKNLVPKLALIVVGNKPSNLLYIHMKERMANQLGIQVIVNHLPKKISEAQLIPVIYEYNQNSKINGILVQSPLPDQLNERMIDSKINPNKDVDGFNPVNMGKLLLADSGFYPVSCTAHGIMTLLKTYRVRLKNANVVIIGANQLVGRPLLAMILNAGATVRILNQRPKNLATYTKKADLVISAVNQINSITGKDLKSGCTVIDVGQNHTANGKLTGDVNFASANQIASKISPVPGGVGPMIIATLMRQTVKLCKLQHHQK